MKSYQTINQFILYYFKPNAIRNYIGLAALIGYSYIIVRVPEFVKYIINNLEKGGTQPELLTDCLIILGLSFSSGLLLFVSRWLIIGASRSIEMRLRNDFFAYIQILSPSFYHTIKTGDLVTRFASDIEQARMLVGPGLMYPGQTILVMCMALYSMLRLNWSMTLLLLIPILILLLYVNLNTRKLHKLYLQSQEIYSAMTAQLQENFSGIRVIKAYCQEEAEYQRLRKINDDYVNKNIEQIKQRGLLFPFMHFIGGTGMVLILWLGGHRVIEGSLSLGDMVQFVIYYQMLMWPIIALGWIINVIHRGMASWRRIYAIMSTEPEISDTATPAGEISPERKSSCSPLNNQESMHPVNSMPAIQGDILFQDLTFAYIGSPEPVLKNISFHIHPGQTLGIIGPTGCGKTTIINILMHLYTVPEGTVFLDGVDINQIPLDVLREAIGYVSQDVFLFSDTIRENILFGLDETGDISEEKVNQAVIRAQLSKDLASFPEGDLTMIGERGITLSGGQKQRTGIARALILNRPILILDDSLSSVDAGTEEAIFQGLQQEMQNRTAIVISHRISTIKNANHILVLDGGKIVQQGTHTELIHQKGLYAQIYRRQILEKSLGIVV